MGSCGKGGLPDTSARIKSRAPFSRRRLLTLQASTPSEPVRIGPRAARSQLGGGPYPVDLIKNELIAESERKNIMSVEDAFKLWNSMLTNLGDTYANQERFLRHYYNAFKADLPPIQNAQVATRSNLIRIYESLLRADIKVRVDALVAARKIYGRVTWLSPWLSRRRTVRRWRLVS